MEEATPAAKRLIKLDLDARPTDFERAVAIPDPITSGVLRVRFTFVWRDTIEGAELFERLLAEARQMIADARAKAESDPTAEAQAVVARHIHVLRSMATGWNIDAPFDDEHLAKFFKRYAGASLAITDEYRGAVLGGGM
jgi:hypothetical protein